MAKNEEADVTVVSGKGQIVIPQSIRERLKSGPKTKLLGYGYDDAMIMKKMEIPDVTKDLQRLYERADKKVAKYGSFFDEEIYDIVQESRRKRREHRR